MLQDSLAVKLFPFHKRKNTDSWIGFDLLIFRVLRYNLVHFSSLYLNFLMMGGIKSHEVREFGFD